MKKFVSFSMIFVLMFSLLVGCGKKSSTLTVYVVDSEALYIAGIKQFREENPVTTLEVVTFSSYEEMEKRLNTELMSGEGPDVLLYNSLNSTADYYKLATSNTLMNLDKQVAKLKGNMYFETILDAGKVNGHQYFVPLSWNILQAYTTEDTITEKQYDDLYTAIPTEAEALKKDDNAAISSLQLKREDVMNLFMEIAGNKLFDVETGEAIAKKESIRETAEYVKVFYDSMQKIESIATKYSNDFAGAVSHFTFLIENYPFMHNLRYYQSVYPRYVEEEMNLSLFTQRDNEQVTAQVIQYGAINANTDNEENAWKLLKCILDTPATMDYSKYKTQDIYYAPVNVKNYEASVNELSTESGLGPQKRVDPLNEKNAQILLGMPSKINEAVIPNASLGELVQECIEPYLLGSDSFDNCYEKLIQRVELYLDE